jgi:hypothetical protein
MISLTGLSERPHITHQIPKATIPSNETISALFIAFDMFQDSFKNQ